MAFESLDKFRARLFSGTASAFGTLGKIYANPFVSILLALIGIAIAVVMGVIGLNPDNYKVESSVDQLWVQKGTRMEGERKFHANTWGVANQQMFIMSSDNVNGSANSKSLDSTIDTMTQFLLFDESDKCADYDGTADGAAAIEAKCETVSQAIRDNSLYCKATCEKIAGKGATPLGFVDKITNKSIDERHLCDTLGRADPDAKVFLPSTYPASPAYVKEFKSTSKYSLVLAAMLPSTHPGTLHTKYSSAQSIWAAHRDAFATTVFDQIKGSDGSSTIYDNAMEALTATLANVSFVEYYTSEFSADEIVVLDAEARDVATMAVAQSILAAYGSWLPAPSGDGNAIGFGYQELAACAANAVSTPVDQFKMAVYMNNLRFSVGQYMTASNAITQAEAAALAVLKVGLQSSSATSVYTTLRDGLPASAPKTWSERRNCPSAAESTAAPTPPVSPSPPSPQDLLFESAGKQAVKAYFAAGADISHAGDASSLRDSLSLVPPVGYGFNASQVTEVLVNFIDNSSDILVAQKVALRDNSGIVLSDSENEAVSAALMAALTSIATGTDQTVAGIAYYGAVLAAVGNDPVKAGAIAGLLQADGTFLQVASKFQATLTDFSTNLGTASIQAPIAEMSYGQIRAMFEIPTLNFTARPLPRNWGIDRFPCSVATVTDVFREGDYALPFNIKRLSEVSLAVAGYLAAAGGLGLPDCAAQAIKGGKEAAYSNYLGTDYSFSSARSAALNEAECVMGEGLMTMLGKATVEEALVANDDDRFVPTVTALALPTAQAYFDAGGSVYDCGSDVITSVNNAIALQYAGPLGFGVASGGEPMLTLTDQEIGGGIFAMFGQLMVETANTGDISVVTSSGFANMAVAFMSKSVDISGMDSQTLNALKQGFESAIPQALQCNTNMNTSDYQCDSTCPGVAVKRAEQARGLCVADNFCLFGAGGAFRAATIAANAGNATAWNLYGQYYGAVMAGMSGLASVGNFVSSLAQGTGFALALEVQAGDQIQSLASSIFPGMGYRYRPTYGSHRTAALFSDPAVLANPFLLGAYMSNSQEAIVPVRETIGDAIRAYYYDSDPNKVGRQRVSQTACIQTHKFPDGDLMRGCFLTWISTFLPPDLVFAQIDYADANATSLETIGKNGITRMGYHRTVLNDYAEGHWLGTAVLDDYLNETTTFDRRWNLHRTQEDIEKDFLDPKFSRATGSKFAPGEAYDTESLYYITASSTSGVLRDVTDVSWTSLIVCIVIMVLLVGLIMTDFNSNVESHFWTGIFGMGVMCVSALTSLGVASWVINIPLTPVSTRVAPFIILGIGVDDMLVISRALMNHAKSGNDVAVSLKNTIAESGPSVTFTTLTNLVAFMIASLFRINVVKWFCQLMSVAVIVNWIFLFLLFIPILALDSFRVKRGVPEFCCPRAPSCNKILNVSYFMKNYYGPFLMNDIVRGVVVFVFLGFFIFQATWGSQNVTIGLRNSDVLPTGTSANEFYSISEEYFSAYSIDLVTDSRAFEKKQTQIDIQMATRAMAGSKWTTAYDESDASTYLSDIAGYANPDKVTTVSVTAPAGCGDQVAPFATTANYTVIAADEFYYAFAAYLNAFGVFGASKFICENTTTHTQVNCFNAVNAYPAVPDRDNSTIHSKDIILIAAYNGMYLRDQNTNENIVDAIKEIRDITDECFVGSEHTSFPTGYTHLYWDQYLHTLEEFITVVGFAILGVFIVTFLFQFSIRSSLLIAIVVLMVVVELFGVIPESSTLRLNAFSIVNLAVSVGIAIELTAHTVHQFLTEQGDDKKQRVIQALEFMGWPMFFGGATTLITTAFLAASDIPFIRAYYFEMFFGMTVISLANGLILVPVLLSLPYVGDSPLMSPEQYADSHETQEKSYEKGKTEDKTYNPTFGF